MFRRLNRYLTPLKPQELRNAVYTGPFVALVTRLADDDYWATNGIVNPASIRRMGDVEFVSELVIGVLHGPQGGSGKIIDEYYALYEDYEDHFPEQRKAERLFAATLRVVQELFPDIKDTRWGNKTDFYTLFVAVAVLLQTASLPAQNRDTVRACLDDFADKVNRRLQDENLRAAQNVISYVRAVEKGANDKARRGERHLAISEVLKPHFVAGRPRA